jgi:hypothetical protein
MSALSGLAAQFGASGVTTDPAQSPAFYADLLRSRDILGAVVDAPLARPGGRTVAVADLLEVPEAEPAVRRERTIRALRERVDVTVSTKTGLLRMTVHAVEPRRPRRWPIVCWPSSRASTCRRGSRRRPPSGASSSGGLRRPAPSPGARASGCRASSRATAWPSRRSSCSPATG